MDVHGAGSAQAEGTDTEDIIGPTSSSASGLSRLNKDVLNRAVQHQTKWKKKVKEQRENIYDKHTMLN